MGGAGEAAGQGGRGMGATKPCKKTLGLFVTFVRGFCPAFQDWPCMFQLQVITS